LSNLTILHLLPKTLKLNGEAGNVAVLNTRASSAGISVRVELCDLTDSLPSRRPEIIFIGSGTISATLAAAEFLTLNRDLLLTWVSEGSSVVAVGSGFDLISNSFTLESGASVPTLGLTDTSHYETNKHLVGEVVLENSAAGFINSDRRISRKDENYAFGLVVSADDKALVGYLDGYRAKNIWASNVQGPWLPMNPEIADEILSSQIGGYQPSSEMLEISDLSEQARLAISRRVSN
jgi:CobQ-like glutamine amidotransferase family enzyme